MQFFKLHYYNYKLRQKLHTVTMLKTKGYSLPKNKVTLNCGLVFEWNIMMNSGAGFIWWWCMVMFYNHAGINKVFLITELSMLGPFIVSQYLFIRLWTVVLKHRTCRVTSNRLFWGKTRKCRTTVERCPVILKASILQTFFQVLQ